MAKSKGGRNNAKRTTPPKTKRRAYRGGFHF